MSEKKTRKAPVLITINDYLEANALPVVVEALQKSLDSGELAGIVQSPLEDDRVTESSVTIEEVKCYRRNRIDFLADLKIMASLRERYEDGSTDMEFEYLIVTLFVSFFGAERTYEVEDIRNAPNGPLAERTDMVELDPWLVPKVNWDEVEKMADQIWLNHYREAYNQPSLRTAGRLLKRLGLETQDVRRPGQEYACVCLSDIGTKVDDYDRDTILINVDGRKSGRARELFKCLIAYEWHYLFYALQNISVASPENIPQKDVPADAPVEPDPISFMWSHLNHGCMALMMPGKFVHEYIANHEEDARKESRSHEYNTHRAARLDIIGRKMADEFDFAKTHIRIRFLQLGYWQAKSIFLWSNRHYTYAFNFDEDSLRSASTHYVVGSRENAIKLYYADKTFREFAGDGSFIYADGLILNAAPGNYEEDGWRGLVPTTKVNDMVSNYCLRMRREYIEYYGYDYGFDMTLFTEKKLPRFYRVDVSEDAAWMRRKQSVRTLLGELIKQRAGSVAALAAASTVPADYIDQLCSEDFEKYDSETMVALCLGLKLPPALSSILLNKAHIDLEKSDPYKRRALLALFYLENVNLLNSYLAASDNLCRFNIRRIDGGE